MKQRTLMSKPNENHIRYKLEGCDTMFSCNKEDWEKYELMIKLIEQGADESLLESLYENGYSQGYDTAY